MYYDNVTLLPFQDKQSAWGEYRASGPCNSAAHQSRRAEAGVLTYFAGAGLCSPLAKTPEALICAANYHCTSAKEFMIDDYGILNYFVYHCGVCKTIGRVKHPIKF